MLFKALPLISLLIALAGIPVQAEDTSIEGVEAEDTNIEGVEASDSFRLLTCSLLAILSRDRCKRFRGIGLQTYAVNIGMCAGFLYAFSKVCNVPVENIVSEVTSQISDEDLPLDMSKREFEEIILKSLDDTVVIAE